MKRFVAIFLFVLLFTGCSSESMEQIECLPLETEPTSKYITATFPHETVPSDPVETLLSSMPLEAWIGQLFLVGVDPSLAQAHAKQYNLGGFLLFSSDFRNETQESMKDKLNSYQSAANIPLLIAVDEEGGTVVRVSNFPAFREKRFLSARDLYSQGGMELVLAQEREKCDLLRSLGVNVNLGPVCDISTDSHSFMYKRSFGQDFQTTAVFVSDMVTLMNSYQIGNTLKHFPGYGNNTDTHIGIAIDSRSLEELEECDLVPFQAGINAGCGAIMVSHTIVDALDPDMPASLSPAVHRYLRETMGFNGVIITDDLTMQAITDLYGAGEAAVLAVLAGNDLLCSTAYIEQYEAVLAAVLEGRIDFDTLKNAARNVLEWKMELGLI